MTISRAIVINLERNKGRLARFIRQFKRSDIRSVPLQRLVGIDARSCWREIWRTVDTSARIFLSTNNPRTRHEQLPSIGGVGCYLSHLAAYRSVRDSRDVVMIMEDDAQIPSNLKSRVDRVLSTAPPDWDIILMRYKTPGWDLVYPADITRLTSFIGLQTYLISPRGAKKVLAHEDTFPIDRQMDGFLSVLARRGQIKIYGAGRGDRMPQPGIFSAAFTTIQRNTLSDLFLSWDSVEHPTRNQSESRQAFNNIKTVLHSI